MRERTPLVASITRLTDQKGVDIELGAWIQDPELGTQNVRSDINVAILEAFRAQGIEIPFPQREIRLLGGSPAPN